jgi:hypothetical protein
MKKLTVQQQVIVAVGTWVLAVICYYIPGLIFVGVPFLYVSSFVIVHLALRQKYFIRSKKKLSQPAIMAIVPVIANPITWGLTVITLQVILFFGALLPGGIGE